MDRLLARDLTTLASVSESACRLAVRECQLCASIHGNTWVVGLVHFIADIDSNVERADLLTRIRMLAPGTFSLVRSKDERMQNDHEKRHLGRPTRVNFRLHFKVDDKEPEELRKEIYEYALEECRRVGVAFGAQCHVESVKFASRPGFVDAQINLVVPHPVGFGTSFARN